MRIKGGQDWQTPLGCFFFLFGIPSSTRVLKHSGPVVFGGLQSGSSLVQRQLQMRPAFQWTVLPVV